MMPATSSLRILMIATALVAGGIFGSNWAYGHYKADQTGPISPDLYFTLESAPKPTPRSKGDGLSQLIQLCGDLEQFLGHGGYSGQQISETAKEDPDAAVAMMARCAPYVDRAHRALAGPSARFVFDPTDADYPKVTARGPGLMAISEMLRAQESIHLRTQNS